MFIVEFNNRIFEPIYVHVSTTLRQYFELFIIILEPIIFIFYRFDDTTFKLKKKLSEIDDFPGRNLSINSNNINKIKVL